MNIHYESVIKAYDKRIEELNSSHSSQLVKISESHRQELNNYHENITKYTNHISELQVCNELCRLLMKFYYLCVYQNRILY